MTDVEPAAPLGGGGLASSLRIRLDFGYDGTAFSGWAMQPGKRTVEDELSAALTLILRASKPVRLVVAGRTDAGVHARWAVAHADVDPTGWALLPGRSVRSPAQSALARLNGVLPADVVIHRVSVAPEGFNARFSAIQRRYLYRICDQPQLLDPLRRGDTLVHRRPLDVEAMHAAAQHLLGLRDFAAFAKKREGATTIRTLLDYSWVRTGDGVLEARVVADAFCRSMVRALVGAVIPVGEGRQPVEWPARVLGSGQRHPGVVVMPAHGLSLEEVTYPPDAEVGRRAKVARVIRIVDAE
ncbi:MAG: tRNA pseudouridine(38-40) synthase TruA [Actinobacteria bacterium]|nr:tRNA pseudouridine(38-40) synthase TruA [Actinomycetota bacterium]